MRGCFLHHIVAGKGMTAGMDAPDADPAAPQQPRQLSSAWSALCRASLEDQTGGRYGTIKIRATMKDRHVRRQP